MRRPATRCAPGCGRCGSVRLRRASPLWRLRPMLEVQWLINRTTIRLRRPNRSPEGLAPQICKAYPDFERGRHHEIEYEFSGNRFNAGLAGSDLRERFMLSNLGPGLPGQQDTPGCSGPK